MPLVCKHTGAVVENFHGTEVNDPFRWLEDRTSRETDRWIENQRQGCDQYFAVIPEYPHIKSELRRRLDVEVVDQPARVGNRYFFRLRKKGEERPSIYIRDESRAAEQVIAKPDAENRHEAIGIYRVASDGKTVAFYRQSGGSDQRSIHLVDVDTGRQHLHSIETGFARGLVFAEEPRGFFYSQEYEGQEHTILFRRLVEPQDERCVFRHARKGWASKLSLIGDSNTLGATLTYEKDGKQYRDLWIARTDQPPEWTNIFTGINHSFALLLYRDRVFGLTSATESGATLTEFDRTGGAIRNIFSRQPGVILQATFAGNDVYVTTLEGMQTVIRRWNLDTFSSSQICGFETGTLMLASAFTSRDSLFLMHEDFCQSPRLYEYSPDEDTATLWRRSEADPASVDTIRTWVPAQDGVPIPVTVVKSSESTCGAAAVVLPYGSFGAAILPHYSAFMSLLLDMGIVLVIPHVRGGGTGGAKWHDAGRRLNKATSVTDLIAVVEHLPSLAEVSSAKIALYGVSGGGLLAAAVAVRAPALLRTVVSVGPLLDMLRYQQFGQARRWVEEFGTSDIEEDFRVLYGYSPYHNIPRETPLPSFLFVTGDKDDRCDPVHVRKMAARLQDSPHQLYPVIVDYSEFRGHAPGLPLEDRSEGLAKRCAFLLRELDVPFSMRRES